MLFVILIVIFFIGGIMFLVTILFDSEKSTAQNKYCQEKSCPNNSLTREEHYSDTTNIYVPPTLPYNFGSHRHSADQEWERGSIVNVGFQKNCIVREVLDNPLHYYLETSAGNPITFFPHKGIRKGWTDYW